MNISKYSVNRTQNARKGVATLEFAMCLPILLLFFAAILWLGVSFGGQSEITMVARNRAWHERHHGNEGDAFKLDRVVGAVSPPPVHDHSRSFSPVFPIRLKSEHMVLGGSWDHHQVKMNEQPSWTLLNRLAPAEMGSVRIPTFDPISKAKGQFRDLFDMIENDWLQQLGLASGSPDAGMDQIREEQRKKLEPEIAQLRSRIVELEGRLGPDAKKWAKDEERLIKLKNAPNILGVDLYAEQNRQHQMLYNSLPADERQGAKVLASLYEEFANKSAGLKALDQL